MRNGLALWLLPFSMFAIAATMVHAFVITVPVDGSRFSPRNNPAAVKGTDERKRMRIWSEQQEQLLRSPDACSNLPDSECGHR